MEITVSTVDGGSSDVDKIVSLLLTPPSDGEGPKDLALQRCHKDGQIPLHYSAKLGNDVFLPLLFATKEIDVRICLNFGKF